MWGQGRGEGWREGVQVRLIAFAISSVVAPCLPLIRVLRLSLLVHSPPQAWVLTASLSSERCAPPPPPVSSDMGTAMAA